MTDRADNTMCDLDNRMDWRLHKHSEPERSSSDREKRVGYDEHATT